VTVGTPDSGFENLERRYESVARLVPYLLLVVPLIPYALSQAPSAGAFGITLGVAAGARVWMDVSSMSGTTESDLEPDEAGAVGEVDLRIKANSASGDIRLQRAAPVAC